MSTAFARAIVFGGVLVGGIAFAQETATDELSSKKLATDMLPNLWTAQELDAKCKTLNEREKAGVDYAIDAMLETMEIKKEAFAKIMAKHDVVGSMTCTHPLAAPLLKLVKAVGQRYAAAASVKAEAMAENEADAAGMSWESIQQSWAGIFKEFPKGQLGLIEGCWQGKLDTHPVDLCFYNKGDNVQFRLGAANAPLCTFSGGEGRSRSASAMFFIPARPTNCSDGSVAQHIEGACKPMGETELDCLLSIYSVRNEIYETRAGEAISGQARLKKR